MRRLWELGDSYDRLGQRVSAQHAGDAYARIVKDYPLSWLRRRRQEETERAGDAHSAGRSGGLCPHEVGAGKPDEGRHALRAGWASSKRGPDVSSAAKSGQPGHDHSAGTVPVSVPPTRRNAGIHRRRDRDHGGTDPSALDKLPDARTNPPAGTTARPRRSQPAIRTRRRRSLPSATPAQPNPQQAAPLPRINRRRRRKRRTRKQKPQPATNPPATSSTTPASTPATTAAGQSNRRQPS